MVTSTKFHRHSSTSGLYGSVHSCAYYPHKCDEQASSETRRWFFVLDYQGRSYRLEKQSRYSNCSRGRLTRSHQEGGKNKWKKRRGDPMMSCTLYRKRCDVLRVTYTRGRLLQHENRPSIKSSFLRARKEEGRARERETRLSLPSFPALFIGR
jgi:hypothetical protein